MIKLIVIITLSVMLGCNESDVPSERSSSDVMGQATDAQTTQMGGVDEERQGQAEQEASDCRAANSRCTDGFQCLPSGDGNFLCVAEEATEQQVNPAGAVPGGVQTDSEVMNTDSEAGIPVSGGAQFVGAAGDSESPGPGDDGNDSEDADELNLQGGRDAQMTDGDSADALDAENGQVVTLWAHVFNGTLGPGTGLQPGDMELFTPPGDTQGYSNEGCWISMGASLTKSISTEGYRAVQVAHDLTKNTTSTCDLDVSVDGGTNWANVLSEEGNEQFYSINLTLPEFAEDQGQVQLRWTAFDQWCWVNNIVISATEMVGDDTSVMGAQTSPNENHSHSDDVPQDSGSAPLPDTDSFWTDDEAGHPGFASPHSNPIGVLPDFSRLYVTNTQADTVDVFDAQTGAALTRIHVGIDPVSIAVRPDGLEVWVSNHVSDTVSVIDADPTSPRHHQVIATIQAIDEESRSTRFDEPVGIAFSENGRKAYVALSSEDTIAVVDVQRRLVIKRLNIRSQDPRALTVAGDRLYVVAFESGNQTQVSGCLPEDIDGDICTFNVEEQSATGEGYDSDITRHPGIPDRDLFVFDTDNDQPVETVSTIGTLLYGVAATPSGKVFISMTEARNDANGRAGTGTPKHSLLELENRAFLNQIGVVECAADCEKSIFELEPLPPQHPGPDRALAIPFGIQVSADETTLVVTAAGSNTLFTLDTQTGDVLGRVDVGWTPRGVALQSDAEGAPKKAWVYNAVENTVSIVDFASPSDMVVTHTMALHDPTDAQVKLGRYMFNNAKASTTGTFACVNCHPDGMADQLMWNLEAPPCNRPGCTQFQLRSTMPIRGLRDTAPYHWDNVPGNPYTVSNGSSLDEHAQPTCDPVADGEYACIRDLVNGSLASSMCDPQNCPPGPSGMSGALTDAERHAMSVFLLSVPHAQGRERPFDDRVTQQARAGFFQWNHNDGRMTCGNHSCHGMPLMTRIEKVGQFAVPSFRGITDRFLLTNNGRFGGMEHQLRPLPDGPDEKTFAVGGLRLGGGMFLDGGYTEQGPWHMLLELAQQGTSGAFGRQVTLSPTTVDASQTMVLLNALESVARGGAIMLRGEGAWADGTPLSLNFDGHVYVDRANVVDDLTREELLAAAAAGDLVVTLTGRMGRAHEPTHPQPILWGDPARNGSWTLVEHFGGFQSWGRRTLSLPSLAEGQSNLRISFRANGGGWINVSDIEVTANGTSVEVELVGEHNTIMDGGGSEASIGGSEENNGGAEDVAGSDEAGGDSNIAYRHGWFTADVDSRNLRNLQVAFTLVSEAPVDVHISDGRVGLNNITFGLADTTRVDFPTNAGSGPMLLKGRHIHPNSGIFVNGQRVEGTIGCTLGGSLPDCSEEKITITLDGPPLPADASCPCPGGPEQEGPIPDDNMHLLQVQTPGGLMSNEFLIFDD